jgi:hypothetical protein
MPALLSMDMSVSRSSGVTMELAPGATQDAVVSALRDYDHGYAGDAIACGNTVMSTPAV